MPIDTAVLMRIIASTIAMYFVLHFLYIGWRTTNVNYYFKIIRAWRFERATTPFRFRLVKKYRIAMRFRKAPHKNNESRNRLIFVENLNELVPKLDPNTYYYIATHCKIIKHIQKKKNISVEIINQDEKIKHINISVEEAMLKSRSIAQVMLVAMLSLFRKRSNDTLVKYQARVRVVQTVPLEKNAL